MTQHDLEWSTPFAGVGFTEGCTPYGDGIAFVSINRGTVSIATLDPPAIVDVIDVGGGPNGAVADRHGNIWIAQNGGEIVPTKSQRPTAAGIQRASPEGTVDLVASDGLLAPNDCTFGPDGRLYFTDPRGSSLGTSIGGVYALDTATGELELLADGLNHPNGLTFTADGDRLIVGETRAGRLILLEPDEDGRWRQTGTFADYPDGEPDGMAFDAQGRLWVAGSAGNNLAVFTADGRVEQVHALPDSFATNVCFAGPQRDVLVVAATKGGRIITTQAPVPGVRLFGGPT